MAGTPNLDPEAFIMRVRELSFKTAKMQHGIPDSSIPTMRDNSQEIKAFINSTVNLLDLIVQRYETMRRSGSAWAALYIRVVNDIEKTLKHVSLINQANIRGVTKLTEALDSIREESRKYRKRKTFFRIPTCVASRGVIEEAREKLLDAQHMLGMFVRTSMRPKPVFTPEKLAEIGGLPGIPEWYVPRADLESDITEKLTGGLKCGVLEGPSGVGKSTTVANLVRPGGRLSHYYEGGVYWMSVGQRGASDKELANLLKELHSMMVTVLGGSADVLPGRLVNVDGGLGHWVAQIASLIAGMKCLVVLDNVVNDHRDFIGPLMMHGMSILVTTPEKCTDFGGSVVKKWDVGGLTREQSKQLVSNCIGTEINEMNGVKRVFWDCNGNPLALTMSASLLKYKMEHSGKDLNQAAKELASDFDNQGSKMNGSNPGGCKGRGQLPSKLRQFIQLSVNALSKKARRFYSMLAVLPHGSHASMEMLQGIWACGDSVCEQKVATLSDLCLINSKRGNYGEVKWGLHDVQMEYVQCMVDESDFQLAKQRQISELCEKDTFLRLLEENEFELARFWGAVGGPDSAECFIEQNKKELEESVHLALTVSNFLVTVGCAERAIELGKSVHRTIGLQDDPELYSEFQTAFGAALLERGKCVEAVKAFKEAVAIDKNLLGNEHAKVAESLSNLGVALTSQGKYWEAIVVYAEAGPLCKAIYGEGSMQLADVWAKSASISAQMGNHSHAEELWRKILEFRKGLLGDMHPNTIQAMNSLAAALSKQGEHNKAEGVHRDVLSIQRKLHGDNHPRVAVSLTNVAITLEEQGEYKEAEKLHNEAFDIKKNVLGIDHPDVADCLDHLGNVLKSRGRYMEAKEMYAKAFSLRRKAFGDEHVDIARSLGNLGNVFHNLGDYNLAINMHRKALVMRRKLLGDEHRVVAETLNNLGISLQQKRQYGESAKAHKESLAISRRVLGNEHPLVVGSLHNLANLLLEQGNCDDAVKLYRETLSLCKKSLGDEHALVAHSLQNLAVALNRGGKHEEAEELFHEALSLNERLLGDHPNVAMSLCGLAEALCNQQEFATAERYARNALGMLRKFVGKNHPHMHAFLRVLARAMNEQGKCEEVRELFRMEHQ